ncbi:G-protein-signaling modulator 2-like isoform X2 [Engraulis encrasicolus]|uniref:G-protein-signaling modulator 2-like isoform X2 n=1 Tax=Engraulis encrasicolus TaxID=184585 RepID=UPI002FD22A62
MEYALLGGFFPGDSVVDMNSFYSMHEDDQQYDARYRMEASCLELALEGERLCKVGDYGAGVSFFESAIQVGTEDLQILSAIYSQLGNAYFHLHDYAKALEYHKHDLTLTRTIGDELGEAKASGNLGNTLKILGRFDEAAVCCQRHLDISNALNDKVGQARALYNYGNVYHAKGKSICWTGMDPVEFPEEARIALNKAIEYYDANLTIVKELGDRAAQGRTYGNLGNTHYLLGNFQNAVLAHEQRLLIAKEFGDRAAERRAYCNLGNAHIFLGQFELAAEHYKRTLQLSRSLRDRAVEAQACYSLGNTYTLLQDYGRAIDYHLKHMRIAQDLNDRVGEGRACWSLGNAYTALGNHEQAMQFAQSHLEISREIGDGSGELTARMNISDLQLVLGLNGGAGGQLPPELYGQYQDSLHHDGTRPRTGRRPSMENMELVKLSPESTEPRAEGSAGTTPSKPTMAKTASGLFFLRRIKGRKPKRNGSGTKVFQDGTSPNNADDSKNGADTLGDEGFFDLLSRFQGNRMDDQRCSVKENTFPTPTSTSASEQPGPFLDLLASSQSRRLDDQRASAGSLPGLSQAKLSQILPEGGEPDDDFFDMLVKCQGSRLDDQRCAAPPPTTRGPTVPDEDFLNLVVRSQGSRIDEQRVVVPPTGQKPD